MTTVLHIVIDLLAVWGGLTLLFYGISGIANRLSAIPNFINGILLPHPAETWEITDSNRDWIYAYKKGIFTVQHFDSSGNSNEHSIWINGSKFITGWRAEKLFDLVKKEYHERHSLNGL